MRGAARLERMQEGVLAADLVPLPAGFAPTLVFAGDLGAGLKTAPLREGLSSLRMRAQPAPVGPLPTMVTSTCAGKGRSTGFPSDVYCSGDLLVPKRFR